MPLPENGRKVLIGDDEIEGRGYLEMALKCLGYTVEMAQDGPELLAILQSSRAEISAVLLDIQLAPAPGVEILREIRRIADLPIIIVSATPTAPDVVSARKTGTVAFLSKPVNPEELRVTVARAVERKVGQGVVARRPAAGGGSFVGRSLRMQEIHASVSQIGWSEAPVLIQGETGSGKEVIARELHAQSPRAGKLFVKLNCAALPSELVESELFGYERGAFTGAFQKKEGMFEVADGGTILLDEIGDMDVRLQAKLLQVLQDQEFQRIGGKTPIKVDVRVMAATHCDLQKGITDKTFRGDLYYRLNVINLSVPPLREREEDIVPLAEFILRKYAPQNTHLLPITGKLKEALTSYLWPGNVRELENVMRRLLVMRDPDLIAQNLLAGATSSMQPAVVITNHSVTLKPAPEPAGSVLERRSDKQSRFRG